ncbi:GNAT family N-acetyltransferase [Bacillus mojavensis]|uniref:GNAT family N-acetyltransferase n=1 Tax=Bacillus mojavensis TaxID=72360 RepID=UPI002DBDB41E|nr:GNAT family protein [Bacillus mojavensis]MEC1668361.1 GNAT family protein [Bacillus mojavensis]
MNLEMIFTDFPVLESEHLVLKKIEETHLQAVFSIYTNDKVFEYCGIIPKHHIKTIHKMINHFERDYQKKSKIKWGIFEKYQGTALVGIIEAMDLDQKVNMITIGYFLGQDYWRKGIATGAVKMLVTFLFKKVNVNRIQAEVMPANEASKKVLLKNNFMREGLIRQASYWAGKGVVDLEIYSILKEGYI